MATEVTICNLALSRIGSQASVSSINPIDGSEESEACSRLYPVALATMLDLHPWAFATKRAELAELADSPGVSKGQWRHAFSLPADCARVVNLEPTVPDEKVADDSHCLWARMRPLLVPPRLEFEVVAAPFGQVLLADLPHPTARYVTKEPKPSQFSGLFTDALAWMLAGYLCGEVHRGDSAYQYVKHCQEQFNRVVGSAMEQDAKSTRVHRRHIPSWILRR